jgi:hypothetical protein
MVWRFGKIDTADFRSIDAWGLIRVELLETVTTLRHARNKGRLRFFRWKTGSVIDLARLCQWIAFLFEQKANAPVLDALRPATGGEIPISNCQSGSSREPYRTRSPDASSQIHPLVSGSRSHQTRRKRTSVAPRT